MQGNPFGARILGGGFVIGPLAAGWAGSDLYRQLVADFGARWNAALGIEGRLQHYIVPGDTLYMGYSV